MQTIAYQNILWATDLGEHGELVGARASDLAQRYAASLSVIHVVAYLPPFELGGELALPAYAEIEAQLVTQAKLRLEKFALKFNVETKRQVVVIGSPRYEIVRMAREQNYDLIIVGGRSKHGLGLLLGSVADGVLHGANCDVMAVKV
ncbi:MAG: universal stress protein [Gammaproteobacteria bacterium]|nr:universal stress protein [Gammaproteobacteria bacterium]